MYSERKNSSLFAIGAVCYGLIEIVWRGKTHWSMPLTGGACFVALYRIFAKVADFSMTVRCLIGGAVITAFEFCSGCIFNKMLKLKVWDYSDRPLNFKGQICPFYSFMWTLLCIPVNAVCKRLRG